MTNSNLTIPDLGAKIDLLLWGRETAPRSDDELRKKLVVSKDLWSRLRNTTRTISEELLLRLCDELKVSRSVFLDDVEVLGRKLGYSRRDIALITRKPLPGIDFGSRIRDPQYIAKLCGLLSGYWETFYYSVSRVDKLVISRDLLRVHETDDDGYVKCEVWDACFRYSGHCFPIQSHLYFILEKDLPHPQNEVIVYATNLPERAPPALYGIILCASGGVDQMSQYPSAAKVAFRFLGTPSDLKKKYELAGSEDIVPHLLNKEKIARYVDPTEPDLDDATLQIFRDIRNDINANAIPLALRMEK